MLELRTLRYKQFHTEEKCERLKKRTSFSLYRLTAKRAKKPVGSYGILDFGNSLVNILAAVTLKFWKIVAAIIVAGLGQRGQKFTLIFAVRLEFCSN
jgi:hypothetical protein